MSSVLSSMAFASDQNVLSVISESVGLSYAQLHQIISDAPSSSARMKLSFEGIKASINEEGDIDINISGIAQELITHEEAEGQLRDKIDEISHKLNIIRIKFQELIQLSGDCEEEYGDLLISLCEFHVLMKKTFKNQISYTSEKNNHAEEIEKYVDNELESQLLAKLRGLNIGENKKVKMQRSGASVEQSNFSMGGLKIKISQISQETTRLKYELTYKKFLLYLFESLCKEIQDDGKIILIYHKQNPKGKAVKIRAGTTTIIGFITSSNILECTYTDDNGTRIKGKLINSFMYGEGQLRLSKGGLFKGKINEDDTASGSIIEGNTRLEGNFKIETSINSRAFVKVGKFKKYVNEELYLEGEELGKEFKGTIYEKEVGKLTGSWINGEPNDIIIYTKDNQKINQLKKGEKTYLITVYQGLTKISEYTLVDKKREGEAYSRNGNNQQWSKFKNDKIFWVKIIGEFNYEGGIQNDQFHGNGEFSNNEIYYKGDYYIGKFHGQGYLENKKGKITFKGTFNSGKFTNGNLVNGDFKYSGPFNCSQEPHGFGELKSKNFTYRGDFRNGKFHGNGTKIQDDLTLTGSFCEGDFTNGILWNSDLMLEGDFRDGLLNGQGIFTTLMAKA